MPTAHDRSVLAAVEASQQLANESSGSSGSGEEEELGSDVAVLLQWADTITNVGGHPAAAAKPTTTSQGGGRRRFSISAAPLELSPRRPAAGAGAGAAKAGVPVLEEIDEQTEDQETLSVTCPPGIQAGETLYVTTPDLEEIEVVVPDGVDVGDVFDIALRVGDAGVSAVSGGADADVSAVSDGGDGFYYEVDGGENAETTLSELEALVASGALTADTSVWTQCLGEDWMTLQQAVDAGHISVELVGAAAPALYYERADGENEEASLSEIQSLIASGKVSADTSVWTVDLGDDWMTLGDAVAAGKISANLRWKSSVKAIMATNRLSSMLKPAPEPEPKPEPELLHAVLYFEGEGGENEEAPLSEIQSLIASGKVLASTSVWTASLGADWMNLEDAVAAGKISVALPEPEPEPELEPEAEQPSQSDSDDEDEDDTDEGVADLLGGLQSFADALGVSKSPASPSPRPGRGRRFSISSAPLVLSPRPGITEHSPTGAEVLDEIDETSVKEGTLTVTCPPGIKAGETLYVTTPDLEEIEVVVPNGVDAGDEFDIAVISPSPRDRATRPAPLVLSSGEAEDEAAKLQAQVGALELSPMIVEESEEEEEGTPQPKRPVKPIQLAVYQEPEPDSSQVYYEVQINTPADEPVSVRELRKRFKAGTINLDTRCWMQGWSNWTPLENCPRLLAAVQQADELPELPSAEQRPLDIEITSKAGPILTIAVQGVCTASAAFFLEVLFQANSNGSSPRLFNMMCTEGSLDHNLMPMLPYVLSQASRFIRRVKEVHRGVDGLCTYLVQVTDERWADMCQEDLTFTVISVAHSFVGELPSPAARLYMSPNSAGKRKQRKAMEAVRAASPKKIGEKGTPKSHQDIDRMIQWKQVNLKKREDAAARLKREKEEEELASVVHPRLKKRISKQDHGQLIRRLSVTGCASMSPTPPKPEPKPQRSKSPRKQTAAEVHIRLHAEHAVQIKRIVVRSEEAEEKTLAELAEKQYGKDRHKAADHDKDWHVKLTSPGPKQLRMIAEAHESAKKQKKADAKMQSVVKKHRTGSPVSHRVLALGYSPDAPPELESPGKVSQRVYNLSYSPKVYPRAESPGAVTSLIQEPWSPTSPREKALEPRVLAMPVQELVPATTPAQRKAVRKKTTEDLAAAAVSRSLRLPPGQPAAKPVKRARSRSAAKKTAPKAQNTPKTPKKIERAQNSVKKTGISSSNWAVSEEERLSQEDAAFHARIREAEEIQLELSGDEANRIRTEEQAHRRKWLQEVPVFQALADTGADGFFAALAEQLAVRIVTRGDIIVNKGQVGWEMYFVKRGRAEVLLSANGEVSATLSEGNFFGEEALFNEQQVRDSLVRAKSMMQVYVLSRKHVKRTLADFPDAKTFLGPAVEEPAEAPVEGWSTEELEKDTMPDRDLREIVEKDVHSSMAPIRVQITAEKPVDDGVAVEEGFERLAESAASTDQVTPELEPSSGRVSTPELAKRVDFDPAVDSTEAWVAHYDTPEPELELEPEPSGPKDEADATTKPAESANDVETSDGGALAALQAELADEGESPAAHALAVSELAGSLAAGPDESEEELASEFALPVGKASAKSMVRLVNMPRALTMDDEAVAEAARVADEVASAEAAAAKAAAAVEAARIADEQEATRVAAEKVEHDRLAVEKAEQEERLSIAKAAAEAEAARIATETAEKERISVEKEAADQVWAAAEKAEQERLTAEQTPEDETEPEGEVEDEPADNILLLDCPAGLGPGDELEVEWKGRDVVIEIPEGVSPGDEFEVEMASDDDANDADDAASASAPAREGEVASRVATLAMSIEDFLEMHDASSCVKHFKEEDIDTLEDLCFVVEAEDDLAELGVSSDQIPKLWPSVLAAQNGDLSTLGSGGATDAVEAQVDAGGVSETEMDAFAVLEAELTSGIPSSLF